ncbi:MAG: hypothetical protein ACR2KX_13635 [Chitinophagaceae bacterium]
MIEIIQTKPGDDSFHLFENFLKEIYPADSIRFKLPDTININYLHACFVLIIDNKVCARAALYNNPHLNYQDKKTWCIGNYESVNDENISSKLIKYFSSEAKKNGAEFLIGPMNGSTWDNYRFSVHHRHPNFFLEPYHHLYYNEHFLNAGFKIIAKYFSSIDTSLKYDNTEVITREKELKNSGVTFRDIRLDEYEKELEKLFEFNATAFKTNFLYTPLNKAEFIKKYAETKKIIDPYFVLLAEDRNKNLIGYFFCINDVFNTKEKSLIIKTIARHPDKKWIGLGHVIGNMIYRRAVEKKYTSVIHAFMYEQGTSTTISKNFFGDIYKNYVLYGKEI